MKRSPLAPPSFPDLPTLRGIRIGGVSAGLKRADKRDLLIAEMRPSATIAGKFTSSKCPSAPVDWCRKALKGGKARVIIANSGNANAFTGNSGNRTVQEVTTAAAKEFQCRNNEIFVASTGVIGQQLDPIPICRCLDGAAKTLSPGNWLEAADAIRTTDTFPKGAMRTADIGGEKIQIVGIAKGSGMIAPDMATMLGFIFTDAKMPASILQKLLDHSTERSFNSITVDSDMSTSDTVLLVASGSVRHPRITSAKDPKLIRFRQALTEVMVDLATQIVRDGEGARKFITIDISGATSAQSAKRIGLAIANSPLVKTALAGEDANWGRIVMAVGKAGERANRDKLSISIGGIPITSDGQVINDYDEQPVAEHLKKSEVVLAVDVGIGRGKARVWTCDLTHDYISINADYRS